jgi:polar amino acid transport system substrate-binding protein
MKQVLQNIKTGKTSVHDVPQPSLAGSGVLVATQASLISAGTEKMVVDFASKGFIGKIKSRPNDVKKIMDKMKRDGLRATLESVFARLAQPMPLGYSASGIVLATSTDITDIKPGDHVACGGAGHAEVMYVPKNLTVAVPDGVDFESASFATVGSIALQGVRIAELVIGEKVAVIGLGLLGLITMQLVKAAGCKVIGSDLDPQKLEMAKRLGCDYVCTPENLVDTVARATDNVGVDATIITAATKSNQPMETSAEITRKKGRISVVGAVKMDVPRSPFYKKELQLRLSMSYGPGRYDPQYEEKGIDYPYAYVPWTEQRNMRCILELIEQGKLDVASLISHQFDIGQAEEAYNLIRGEMTESYLGVVLTYPEIDERKPSPEINIKAPETTKPIEGKIRAGVIGAGNFATMTMLPAMKSIDKYSLSVVADQNGAAAEHAKGKFGFSDATGDYKAVLGNPDIDVVFVTTRHNNHAQLVKESLQANKNVMVEKPLCLNEQQLYEIIEISEEKPQQQIMVGFNRRFAPLATEVKKQFENKGPFSINYICNAGFTPKDSWTQDPAIGGGRIIGEACHFIDWIVWFTGAAPVKVYAQSIGKESSKAFREDNVMISVQLDDGSIATISYLASGDKSYTKEHIEIFGGGCIGIIDDYKKGRFVSSGVVKDLKGTSKGHREQWDAVATSIQLGQPMPIPFEEIVTSTWTTFKAIESLHTGQAIEI